MSIFDCINAVICLAFIGCAFWAGWMEERKPHLRAVALAAFGLALRFVMAGMWRAAILH